jgi:hypothetical protein
MKTIVDSVIQPPSAQAGQIGRDVLIIRPKSRLGWRLFGAVLLEVLSIIALIVLLASGQFNWGVYALGMVSVVIPLGLLTWGFRLLVLDEARAQAAMDAFDQRPPDTPQPALLATVSTPGPQPEQRVALQDQSSSKGTEEQRPTSEREMVLR